MKIGDKVVCVDDSPCRYCKENVAVKANNIYVIEELQINRNGEVVLTVLGVGDANFCHNRFYFASRFHLLDELKQQARQQAAKEVK